jgi:hypothetical protein
MLAVKNEMGSLKKKIHIADATGKSQVQQLARKRSEHTSMTVGACKRLAFQSLSVALQTANARMLRSTKALVAPLSLLPLPGAAS